MNSNSLPPDLINLPPIDPLNLRPLVMLDVARQMMLRKDWPYRAVSVVFESHAGPTERFSFYGANRPRNIDDVHERKLDISIMNPVVMLNMARLGKGAYTSPRDVATIAILPHHDQLAFAVADTLGFHSLADIAAERYPLKVSVRGSLDAVTSISIDVVLRSYGFSLDDITAWGGSVIYDQPMPPHPSRLGRLKSGEIDAIFEEGAIGWADQVSDAGASLFAIDDEHLRTLEEEGFRRGVIEKSQCPSLPADVQTLDYSGWPLFCRTDTADELVEQFCSGLESGKDHMVWGVGPVNQAPLPLAQMVTESPSTPFDVPLHARARAFWRERGYLD